MKLIPSEMQGDYLMPLTCAETFHPVFSWEWEEWAVQQVQPPLSSHNANLKNLHLLRLPCFSSCPHIHELLLILKLSV